MPIEFEHARPSRRTSAPKPLKPAERSTEPIQRGRAETMPRGKGPSARPDSHVLAGRAESRLDRAAEEKLSSRPRVLTADEYVEHELRASRGWHAPTDEAKLGEAESNVDRKIGSAVIRGDVAEVDRLERRKAAIGDAELRLANVKIERQRELDQKKVRAQMDQDHLHAMREKALAKESSKRREESKIKNTNRKDRISKTLHAEYAKILARENQHHLTAARWEKEERLAEHYAERARLLGMHPFSVMVSHRGIVGAA